MSDQAKHEEEQESDMCLCGYRRMAHWNPSSDCYCTTFTLAPSPLTGASEAKTSAGCEARGHVMNSYNAERIDICGVCGYTPSLAQPEPKLPELGNSQLTDADMTKLGLAAFWCDKYVSHRTGEETLPTVEEAEKASAMIHEVMESSGPAHIGGLTYRQQLLAALRTIAELEAKNTKLQLYFDEAEAKVAQVEAERDAVYKAEALPSSRLGSRYASYSKANPKPLLTLSGWIMSQIERAESGEQELQKVHILLNSASNALRSYQLGNDSPYLAEEIADAIDTYTQGTILIST